MIKSILCVVEFDRLHRDALSAASRSALRHAAALSGAGGRVTVLHVLPAVPRTLIFANGAAREFADSEPARLEAERQRLASAVDAERTGARVEVRVVRGLPLDEIDRAAAAIDADLIVAGYQDRPLAYTEGFSFRSLLHRAQCPVFVTRAQPAAAASAVAS